MSRPDVVVALGVVVSLLFAPATLVWPGAWAHLLTPRRLRSPDAPFPSFGWGDLPDQYGRRFADDDGSGNVAPDPRRVDLPAFFDWWGSGASRYPD